MIPSKLNIKVLASCFLVTSSSFILAQGLDAPLPVELLALKTDYDQRVSQDIGRLSDTRIVPLGKSYFDALTRLQTSTKLSRNLEHLKAVEEELQDFEIVRKDPGKWMVLGNKPQFPALKNLRNTYLSEIEKFEAETSKRVSPLKANLRSKLTELSNKFIKENDTASAYQVTTFGRNLDLAVCRINGGKYELLQPDAKILMNRNYTWSSVPDEIKGCIFNQTAGGAQEAYVIEVMQPGTIYVAADDDVTNGKILHSLGFKKSGTPFRFNGLTKGETLQLYQRYVALGFKLCAAPAGWTGFIVIANFK
jgi:hypothetical protein